MYKLYSYDRYTELTTIEYGFAKSILNRAKELLNVAGIEIDMIQKIPFSLQSLRKCMKHHRFIRKD